MELSKLTLTQIASLIEADWSDRDPIYDQYIEALQGVKHGYFMAESEALCIGGILSNSKSWRGEIARRIKKELRDRLKKLNKRQA